MPTKQKVPTFPIFLGSAFIGLIPALVAASGSFHEGAPVFFSVWIAATFVAFSIGWGVSNDKRR